MHWKSFLGGWTPQLFANWHCQLQAHIKEEGLLKPLGEIIWFSPFLLLFFTCVSNLHTFTQVAIVHKTLSSQTRFNYKNLASTLDRCEISVSKGSSYWCRGCHCCQSWSWRFEQKHSFQSSYTEQHKINYGAQRWICDNSWLCALSSPLGTLSMHGLENQSRPCLLVRLSGFLEQAVTVQYLPNEAGEIKSVTALEDWSIMSRFCLWYMAFDTTVSTTGFKSDASTVLNERLDTLCYVLHVSKIFLK